MRAAKPASRPSALRAPTPARIPLWIVMAKAHQADRLVHSSAVALPKDASDDQLALSRPASVPHGSLPTAFVRGFAVLDVALLGLCPHGRRHYTRVTSGGQPTWVLRQRPRPRQTGSAFGAGTVCAASARTKTPRISGMTEPWACCAASLEWRRSLRYPVVDRRAGDRPTHPPPLPGVCNLPYGTGRPN